MKRSTRTLIVGNVRGIHGRVATALAEIAATYQVTLVLCRGEEHADCSSILDVLALALVWGTEVRVEVEGARAEAALRAVAQLLTAEDDPQ